MATHAQALRVLHAVRLLYADQLSQQSDPQLIPNYCVAPGIHGYGIVWDTAPKGWPGKFPELRDAFLDAVDPLAPGYVAVDTEAYANVYYGENVLLVR